MEVVTMLEWRSEWFRNCSGVDPAVSSYRRPIIFALIRWSQSIMQRRGWVHSTINPDLLGPWVRKATGRRIYLWSCTLLHIEWNKHKKVRNRVFRFCVGITWCKVSFTSNIEFFIWRENWKLLGIWKYLDYTNQCPYESGRHLWKFTIIIIVNQCTLVHWYLLCGLRRGY